ncbi:MAG: hypothetical protein RL007_2399 [Bacteroidota bacterium]|jgi:Domain of unknown function (DUF4249)
MKTSAYIFISSLLLLAATSCQKVIEIELNESDPQVVIEANITDQAGPYTVTVTKSVGFSSDNSFPAVTGAFIVVNDDAGNADTLIETSPGIYQTNSFQGVPGRTYTINVSVDGIIYTAQSTMPPLVTFDSIVYVTSGGFGGTQYYIIPEWQDPAGVKNYYRCVEYVNGERVFAFLYDDVYSDGLVNGQPILNFETSLESGDTVDVEFQCIDPATYLYFYSMEQTANNNTAAPANPESNFNNDALGYFSAHTYAKRRIILP